MRFSSFIVFTAGWSWTILGLRNSGKTPYFVLWPGCVFQQIWGIFGQEFRSSKTEGFTGGFRSEGRTGAVKKQDEEGAGQSWIPGNVEAIALEIILFCFSTHGLQIRDFL